jgi:ribose transport system substrate-binding protein
VNGEGGLLIMPRCYPRSRARLDPERDLGLSLRQMRRRHALLSLAALSTLLACRSEQGGAAGPKKLRLAVIPKGTTHEFWKSVHAGAEKAAQELGDVELIWKGPLKEDDLKSQIDIVQTMVAQGVAGIILAPLNDKALVNPVKSAGAAKIPVVIIDSDLAGKDYLSFIATDNVAAGGRAAEHLGKALGGAPGARVLVLRYQEGSASTMGREEGFLKTLKASFPAVAIVSDNQYGGATTESARTAAVNLLAAHKAAEGGVSGVFCPNESTTFGMLLALQQAGLTGKVKLVGFDASEKLVQGLRDGQIEALVVQNPLRMGELAVKALRGALRGEKPEARVDTGSTVVTRADVDSAAVKELLHPDLKKWLKE